MDLNLKGFIRNCTGLEIEIDGKRYAFSATKNDEQSRRPIGFQQFPSSLVEFHEEDDNV